MSHAAPATPGHGAPEAPKEKPKGYVSLRKMVRGLFETGGETVEGVAAGLGKRLVNAATPKPKPAPGHPAPAPAPAPAPGHPAPAPAPAPGHPAPAPGHPAPAPAPGAPAPAPHGPAHGATDGKWSTGKKIGVGVAATAGVATLAAVVAAGAGLVYGAKKTIEHGPGLVKAAAKGAWNFASRVATAPFTFLGHALGQPVENLSQGIDHGANTIVGEGNYEEVKGWTAPWKATKNFTKGFFREPARTLAGAGMGALGATFGLFKGIIEGGRHALGGDPNWEMPTPAVFRRGNIGHTAADNNTHHIEIEEDHGDAHGHAKAHAEEAHEEHADAHGHVASATAPAAPAADAHTPTAAAEAHHRKFRKSQRRKAA